MKAFLAILFLLIGAHADAAPFLTTAEVFKAGPDQPTGAYCMVGERKVPGRIRIVTSGVKPECDIAGFLSPLGDVPARIVTTSEGGESPGITRTLRISNPAGCYASPSGKAPSIILTQVCTYLARVLPAPAPTVTLLP
jgi:hypothetical protein